jgi:UPF0755 protein
MRNKFAIRLIFTFQVIIFACLLTSCDAFFGGKTLNTKEVTFIIETNSTLKSLADKLKKKKLIDDESQFISKASESGLTDQTLAFGKYRIKPQTKLNDLIFGFTKDKNGNGNNEELVNVNIYNFRDINQLASQVQKSIAIDSAEFVSYLESPKTLKLLGLNDKRQLSAVFIPKSYRMYFDTDITSFVQSMKQEFDNFWTIEKRSKLKSIGLKSPVEAVILASIVYAEQGKNKEEWPIISALYLNRLKKDMKLQSDPTFKYCWGDALNGTQRLLGKHRNIDCAYNTYKIQGLPPGPICFVPSEVVSAIIQPAQVDYIFMCATPDYSGKHNFAVSDVDHLKNAKIYQVWIAEQEKKQGKK